MSRKLFLKRSYADIVKGTDCTSDKLEKHCNEDDDVKIVAEEWANGEPGHIGITPAMCTFGYKRQDIHSETTSPEKKRFKRKRIWALVNKLPSFDDDWELPEVRTYLRKRLFTVDCQ